MKLRLITICILINCSLVFGQKKSEESVVDRFLRYAKFDTQSQEDLETTPTTNHQFAFAKRLVAELKSLGLQNISLDDHCFVFATLPSNLPKDQAKEIPVIGLISHIDTSPAVSGKDVHPVIHTNYQGDDIILPNDPKQVLSVAKNPRLKDYIGDSIITADGTTLLGADDKAGVAEIMTAMQALVNNPSIKHGTVKIAFTPDEETGTGIGKFDVKKFGARYAYTIDGGTLGEINEESWNADQATVTFHGKSTHPGTAKGMMVNSMYAAADFLLQLPDSMKPETTEKREGFIHPDHGTLGVEESSIKFILRDFDESGLDNQHAILKAIRDSSLQHFPGTAIDLDIKPDYRNMKVVLDSVPFVIANAVEACKRAGVVPEIVPIRGGTDGSDLTFVGLPCPNIFTGGENFHSKLEWVPVRGMNKAVETLLNLIQIWREKNS